MRHLKIGLVLALALILQTTLSARVWEPFIFVDLPLIVVVYFALQRDAMQAITVGVIAGLASDALGAGGLLGAGGFSKTLTAYLIVTIATRVMLDNPLARIPVIAGAVLFDDIVYVLLHRMLGQTTKYRFIDRAPLKLIATTVIGTLLLYLLDLLFSDRARQRRQLAFRRRIARRSQLRIGRKR